MLERYAFDLNLGATRSSMLVKCGPKHKDLSSITPSRRGVGLYLIVLSSMLIVGVHFVAVSLVDF